MSQRDIHRRYLLGSLAAVVSASVTVAGVRRFEAAKRHRQTARRLTGLLGDKAAIAPLGRAYIAATEETLDLDGLIDALEQRLGDAIDALDDDTLLARLATAVREDFDQDDTVEVHGWVLARTSVRLAAIAALA
jgi:hypothetical protein